MSNYSQVFLSHRGNIADKWSSYLYTYDSILERFYDSELGLLELGVNSGGSLEVLAKCFSKSHYIVGLDTNPDCKNIVFADQRISVLIGDSTSSESYLAIKAKFKQFCVIIDDASHQSRDIIANLLLYIGLLSDGGIYVIEDLCCSYWGEFGGGLHNPSSAMNFLKDLADCVNYQHWSYSSSIQKLVFKYTQRTLPESSISRLSQISTVMFVNSMCVITLSGASRPAQIGPRVCRGLSSQCGYVPKDGQDIAEISPT